MLFGHLAVSALLHHYLDAEPKAVVAGGLFPDVVDKTLCQVLHLTPSGRMYAHTLLGAAFSTAAVSALWVKRAGVGWVMGYLGHLAADSGGSLPLFYPFKEYEFPGSEPGLFQIVRKAMRDRARMGVELALVAWAACVLASRLGSPGNASQPTEVEHA
jgi:hypothetical protein